MSIHPHAAAYRREVEAFNARDLEAISELLDPDVRWHFPGKGLFAANLRGREELMAYLKNSVEVTDGTLAIDTRYIGGNDHHVITVQDFTATMNGETKTFAVTSVMRWEDGVHQEKWFHPHDQQGWDEFFAADGPVDEVDDGTEHPDAVTYRGAAEGFRRGDLPAVAATFNPEVVWHFPGRSRFAVDFQGLPTLVEYLTRAQTSTGGTFELIDTFIAATDHHVLAVQQLGATLDGVRKTFEVPSVMRFEDGKHTERWFHPVDLDAFDEFFKA